MIAPGNRLQRLNQECKALRADLAQLESLALRLRNDIAAAVGDTVENAERGRRLEQSLSEIAGQIGRMTTILTGREQALRRHEQIAATRRRPRLT